MVKRAKRKTKRKTRAAATARAGRAAATPAKMYRTNMRKVPKVAGLKRKDGWVDMQVQFLIDKRSAGADHVIGWTVLKPGARHERHRHHNCEEFFIVLKGRGHIYTDEGEAPSAYRESLRNVHRKKRAQVLCVRNTRNGFSTPRCSTSASA